MKEKHYGECQIAIRFAWKVFKRRKERKLAKKREAAEKAKQGKYGNRAARAKTIVSPKR